MQSVLNRIILDIYKERRLTAVPVFAALLSLSASWAIYGGMTGPWEGPMWFWVWLISLPLMFLPAPSMRLAGRTGVSAAVSFAAAMAVMTIIACSVYAYGITVEEPMWRRVCAGLSVSTVPYLVSCAVVALATRRHKDKSGTESTRRYSAFRMDFLSERGKVELSITSDRFLYMESESNYLKVVYLDTGTRSRERVATQKIRSSLKSTEARFGRLPLVKVNRSCVVNRERIDYVVKEGRGGMLKLHGYDEMLKISQQNYSALAKYTERSQGRKVFSGGS